MIVSLLDSFCLGFFFTLNALAAIAGCGIALGLIAAMAIGFLYLLAACQFRS